jgi:hypothetical protein
MITFVATAHQEKYESYQFLTSLILQKDTRWKCIVYCDGKNEFIEGVVNLFNDDRITLVSSEHPKGFWGHYNRKDALDNLVDTEFVIQTSIQDYYTPNTVGEILKLSNLYDFIRYSAIHNHIDYNVLEGYPGQSQIDWGMFAVRTTIAKEVGINYVEHPHCDGLFAGECMMVNNIRTCKIDKILTIHN